MIIIYKILFQYDTLLLETKLHLPKITAIGYPPTHEMGYTSAPISKKPTSSYELVDFSSMRQHFLGNFLAR